MPFCIRVVSSFSAALLLAGCTALPPNTERTVALAGNVNPMARSEFDQGAADAVTPMNRMLLTLKPTAARQAELDALVAEQQNPASALYHHWLTPAEYGARFGASDGDLAQVTAWLAAQGFTVEEIPEGRQSIVFSGTAAQVAQAFHTEIHRYNVEGVEHTANAQEPEIPAALADVVGGVVSLNDFHSQPAMHAAQMLAALPEYSAGSTHYLFPADFAAIYDINSLYSAGTKGAGVKIAIAGRSNINLSDVASFRSLAGLAANAPTVILDGADPGLVSGDQLESSLDVEWSGAVAPQATVDLVAAASTSTTDGIALASQYIVNHATAPVMSVSYESCEQDLGSAALEFYNSLWQQAASEGISVFVASGDAGAAGCAAATDSSGSGTAVNGLCSSPYATCVGGTEFNEGASASQYWSSTNSSNYGSALGYIPEKVWNESALDGGAGMWASGGGVSKIYAQPSWQQGVSGASAAGGMRAVPDVSLSAAAHDGYLTVKDGSYVIVAGTSAAAPSFAGIMALVVQKQSGTGQGSANSELYALASASTDPFHVTSSGNNSVPGVNGYTASGANYNLATGLGSVDGALLVNAWNTSSSTQSSRNACTSASALHINCAEPPQATIPFAGIAVQ
jgi:subtilase family serine protease